MKNYISLQSSPYKISRDLLKPIYFNRTCATPCGNECCDEGIYIHGGLVETILQEQEQIKKLLRRSVREGRWFDTGQGLEIDTDLPHRPMYVNTKLYPNEHSPSGYSCAFITDSGHCALHQRGIETTPNEPWRLKPLYCWLFPIIIVNNVVKLARPKDLQTPFPLHKRCLRRTQTPTLGIDLFEPELRYLLKEPAFEELKDYAKKTHSE